MKKILSLILTCCIIASILPITVFVVRTSAATSGYYTYEVSDGSATITAVSSDISGDIVIPDTLGDCPVTEIGSEAFEGCRLITGVTIPDSVTSIGTYAFYDCWGLTSVTVPDSVTTITTGTFGSCTSLTTVNLPDTLTCIWKSAFAGCTGLTGITIPNSVTEIGNGAFSDCTSLTGIAIPDSVTSIGNGVFMDCTSLTKATVYSRTAAFGEDVFHNTASDFKLHGYTDSTAETYASENGHTFVALEESKFTDVHADNIYYDAICDMTEKGIIKCTTDNAFGPNSEVSRIDIALYLARALTGEVESDEVWQDGDIPFEDVTSYKGAVQYVYENNILTGTSTTTFAPLDSVTYIHALVCAIRALGYDEALSYPYGYYTKAKELGLTANVDVADGIETVLNRAEVAQILCNMIYITPADGSETFAEANFSDDRTIVASGECGDDLTWTLYDDGELVIDGTGAMWDWSNMSAVPWCNYRAQIKAVTIGDGATSIGDYAFQACNDLMSVTAPNSVITIGISAFRACHSLASVAIPNSVTSIETSAFRACIALTGIDIPDSVISIGAYAFTGCSNLVSAKIGAGVTNIGSSVFSYCSKLTAITVNANNSNYANDEYGVLFDKSKTILIQYPIGNVISEYTVPSSVISIGSYAFEDCSNLITVNIPDSVKKIESAAFQNCDGLTSISIPTGVTSIGNYVFYHCSNLAKATIYSKTTTIGKNIFTNTPTAFELYGYTGSTAETYASENGHTFVALDVIASGTCGGNITWTLYDDGELVIDGTGAMYDYAYDNLPPYYNYLERITSVTIVEGVTSVGNYAFGDFENLVNVSIPDSVTTIGENAFKKCTSLTALRIPNSVTSIKAYALSNCCNIADIHYDGCRTQWDRLSAENMLGNRWDYKTGSDTEKGAYTLHFAEISYAVVSAPSDTSGDGLYYDIYVGSEFIKSAPISLPDGQDISGTVYEYGLEDGIYRLNNCIGSENYYIFGLFNALVADDDYAKLIYSAADGFSSDDISSLTYHAYSDNHFTSGETIVDMESNISSQFEGKLQFTDGKTNGSCDGLRLCTDAATVFYFISYENSEDAASQSRSIKQYIGSGEDRYIDFDNSTRIFSDGIGTENTADLVFVIDAKDSDFFSSVPDSSDIASGEAGSLKWAVSADGKMTISGEGSLTDITHNTPWSGYRDTVTAVKIGAGVTEIDNTAFAFCNNLTAINVDEANESYTSIEGVLYTKDGKTMVCYPAGKADATYTIPEGTTAIVGYAFRSCESLISVTVPDSVTVIGNYAFWGCEGIESVTIGEGVTSIGTWAFAYCDSLTAIEVDEGNTKYASVDGVLYTKDMKTLAAYPANKPGTSYTIPEGVTRIMNYAFSGCSNLTGVTIPASMKTVGNCVFDDCTKLTSVSVAEGNEKYISLNGVLYSSDMTTLLCYPAGKADTEFTVPETVTSIGRYAFSDCDSLVTVNIGTNITSIGYMAFAYCDNLANINYAGTETEWDSIQKGSCWNRYLDGDEVKLG